MKIFIVWLRNDLVGVYTTKEKAQVMIALLEQDYGRKGVAWYTEEQAQ